MRIIKAVLYVAAAGVLGVSGYLGYDYARNAGSVLKDGATAEDRAAMSGETRLNEDAVLTIKYKYLMCGHEETAKVVNYFGEKTMEELDGEAGVTVRKFGADSAEIVFEVENYCPEHYILKIDEGKLYVFKTSRETAETEKYIDLHLDVGFIEESEKKRLYEGVVFEKTSDINGYLWELKN